jgi:hypothetical protein
VIQFEPAVNRIVLDPGKKITIEWPDWNGRTLGKFYFRPGELIIEAPSAKLGEGRKVWNDAGEEITYRVVVDNL